MTHPDLVGTILAGRYRITGLLGRGGMGSVYLGEHVTIGRKTAIKVLHADADDADAIARFIRGSRNAARIDHPNVCRVFDYGDPPGGLHFLAMEFIEGESLYDLMNRKGAIPIARAAEIIKQTANALQAAHSLGIVHRDLKPGNIMLTQDSQGRELVKVVDFDIAKGPSETGDEEITKLDWIVGTPEYMSPEQFMSQPLDGRSDIYSLGIILFRMVSGVFPFQGTSPQAILVERVSAPPRTLSEVAPEMDFPAPLQGVIDRALEQDREDRWATAAQFGEAALTAVGQDRGEESPDAEGLKTLHVEEATVLFTGPEATTVASDDSERAESTVATQDLAQVVDPPIPATAPSEAPAESKEEASGNVGRSWSGLQRAVAATATTLVLAASAWAVGMMTSGADPTGESSLGETVGITHLDSADETTAALPGTETAVPSQDGSVVQSPSDPAAGRGGAPAVAGTGAGRPADEEEEQPEVLSPVFDPDAEASLSALETEFESFLIEGVPVSVAERADSIAREIFERSDASPELRAHAADVLAFARGYLDDCPGAISWARMAVGLAPLNGTYQMHLNEFRRNLENCGETPDGSP